MCCVSCCPSNVWLNFPTWSKYRCAHVWLAWSNIISYFRHWTLSCDNIIHPPPPPQPGLTVGLVNTHYVYLPIPVVISAPRTVDPRGKMWNRLRTSIGQPNFVWSHTHTHTRHVFNVYILSFAAWQSRARLSPSAFRDSMAQTLDKSLALPKTLMIRWYY